MKWVELITNQKGQSLIEVLIAMGVFVLMVSVVAWLVIDVYLADRSARERIEATFLAQEGIEAVRSIRDSDFDNLTPGTYGLGLSDNNWTFSGSYDDHGKFRRQIIISNVASEIDQTDIKKIESRVTWQISPLRQVSVSLTDYLTDWKQTQGDAGEVVATIDNARLTAGNQRLEGITIENTSDRNITIDKITVWWENSQLIEEIRIEGTKVWRWNGEGSLDGRQPSGTELDIEDYTMAGNSGVLEIDRIDFDGSMEGSDFMIKLEMTDGSTKFIFIPEPAAAPPSCPSQSDTLVIDISGAYIGGGGNKELQGITIENTDTNCAITIDKITATWDNTNKIEEIRIGGTKVWSKNGPGTPTGKQPSGTEIDIQDFTLSASSGQIEIDKFKFDGNMNGATFNITFTMSDGSTKSTGNFSPLIL